MLVLSRKVGEEIWIGDDASIKVTLVQIQGNRVRIGIEAPKDVTIVRREIAKGEGEQPALKAG